MARTEDEARRDRIQFYRGQIEDLEKSIAMMESGQLKVWSQEAGQNRVDMTAAHIALSRSSIRMLQAVVDEAEAKLD